MLLPETTTPSSSSIRPVNGPTLFLNGPPTTLSGPLLNGTPTTLSGPPIVLNGPSQVMNGPNPTFLHNLLPNNSNLVPISTTGMSAATISSPSSLLQSTRPPLPRPIEAYLLPPNRPPPEFLLSNHPRPGQIVVTSIAPRPFPASGPPSSQSGPFAIPPYSIPPGFPPHFRPMLQIRPLPGQAIRPGQPGQPPFLYPFPRDPSSLPRPLNLSTPVSIAPKPPNSTLTSAQMEEPALPIPTTATSVYSAIYSGIPVYEIICGDLPVMRRMGDHYLNATQILKVAGLLKAHRTKVLEKDVANGVHEKVQGGYGKYQGTWIPLEAGRELAARYKVDGVLRPLLYFDPETQTAGPKPHMFKEKPEAKLPVKPRKLLPAPPPLPPPEAEVPEPSVSSPQSSRAESPQSDDSHYPEPIDFSDDEYEEEEKSPVRQTPWYRQSYWLPPARTRERLTQRIHGQPSFRKSGDLTVNSYCFGGIRSSVSLESLELSKGDPGPTDPGVLVELAPDERKKEVLMKIFLDEDIAAIKMLLTFNQSREGYTEWNMVLDKMGCTAIHWTAYLGRTRLLRSLILYGAHVSALTRDGETALMRAVAGTNNFEQFTFPEVLRELKQLLCVVDKRGRTVLHHIAMTAEAKAKQAACEYYMLIMAKFLVEEEELDFVDIQTTDGNTALHIACRIGNEIMTETLLRLDADMSIVNDNGETAMQVVPVAKYGIFRRLFKLAENQFEELDSDMESVFEDDDQDDPLTPTHEIFEEVSKVIDESNELKRPRNKLLIALSVSSMQDMLKINYASERTKLSHEIEELEEEIENANEMESHINSDFDMEIVENERLKRLTARLEKLEVEVKRRGSLSNEQNGSGSWDMVIDDEDDELTSVEDMVQEVESIVYERSLDKSPPRTPKNLKRRKTDTIDTELDLTYSEGDDGFITPKHGNGLYPVDSYYFTPQSSPFSDLVSAALSAASSLLDEENNQKANKRQAVMSNGEMTKVAVVGKQDLESLKENIADFERQKRETMNQILQIKESQQAKRARFQKLIAACCNVGETEVEQMFEPLGKCF
ncbi:hypothetical protein HK098_007963 [Nowakowskiella sp. JEL0407]|nr:hypothetical protein HK098_007963 [Nowakowskiella sp. JEL0407]